MATDKKQYKRSIIISITLLLSLTIAVVSLSYSWFIYQQPNRTHVFDVNVETSYNLRISETKVWGETVDEDWHRNFSLKPITGDSENFFLPLFETREVTEGSGIYDQFPSESEFVSVEQANLSSYMYRLDFILSIEGFVDLYLDYVGDRTYVRPASESNDGKYGYSADNVCAAVRLAIFQEGKLKCIWIPNSTLELSEENGQKTLKDGACEERYIFRHENDGMAASAENSDIILTNGQPNGSYTDSDTGIVYIWGDISEENCPQISRLRPGINNMSILVWLDGTDRECDISMSEGRIDANVCFAITPEAKKE